MGDDDKTRRLGEAPVGKLFLKLALPAVLGQLATLLNNIIDRIWVGHIAGDGMRSLGAVGIGLPIHHVFLALVLMLAAGWRPASVFCSARAIGSVRHGFRVRASVWGCS